MSHTLQHELDELALVRFAEVSYWKSTADGLPIVKRIEKTIAWREEVGAARLKAADVQKEAQEGKMYVRGHDRQVRCSTMQAAVRC
jgi:hypothetical protein